MLPGFIFALREPSSIKLSGESISLICALTTALDCKLAIFNWIPTNDFLFLSNSKLFSSSYNAVCANNAVIRGHKNDIVSL